MHLHETELKSYLMSIVHQHQMSPDCLLTPHGVISLHDLVEILRIYHALKIRAKVFHFWGLR